VKPFFADHEDYGCMSLQWQLQQATGMATDGGGWHPAAF
jgi:hypothetical protein